MKKRELESEKERCFIITMTGERVRETQGDEVRDGVRQWRVIERVRKTNRGGDRGKNEEKTRHAKIGIERERLEGKERKRRNKQDHEMYRARDIKRYKERDRVSNKDKS